jgi:hypothetical protein
MQKWKSFRQEPIVENQIQMKSMHNISRRVSNNFDFKDFSITGTNLDDMSLSKRNFKVKSPEAIQIERESLKL